MIIRKALLFTTTISAFALTSCGGSTNEKESNSKDTALTNDTETQVAETTPAEMYSVEKGGIKVYGVEHGKEFPDAKLDMLVPNDGEVLPPEKFPFIFNVQNYELAKPTDDEADRHCAASAKGQHIHFIVDNAPYTAHYEPSVQVQLEPGKHTVLAFLSRSYHESIKNGTAYVLRDVYVDQDIPEESVESTEPMLFYSRPKGEYSAADGRYLLDFFLVNVDLSEMGYTVKAVIDGQEFILPEWRPYMVEGLSPGEHSFRIVLIDPDGNQMEDTDSGERVITITEAVS